MPTPEQIARISWLTEDDLSVYAGEFGRTGFQGGLNWYRCTTFPGMQTGMELFAGRKLEVPSMFVGGERDWRIHQVAGALAGIATACTDYRGTFLVPRAGHWVQQEEPHAVVAHLLRFLNNGTR